MNIREASIIKSNGFKLDPSVGQLSFDDHHVSLSPVNTKVLACLMESSPSVVSRSDLFEFVWPNQEISDDALTKCVSEVRQAVSQLSDKPHIKTHPKKGYSWPQLPAPPHASVEVKPAPKNHTLFWLGLLTTLIILASAIVNSVFSRPDIIEILPIKYQHGYQQIDGARLQSTLTSYLTKVNRFKVRTELANSTYDQHSLAFRPKSNWYVVGSISSIQSIERLTVEVINSEYHTVVYSNSFEYHRGELNPQVISEAITGSMKAL